MYLMAMGRLVVMLIIGHAVVPGVTSTGMSITIST